MADRVERPNGRVVGIEVKAAFDLSAGDATGLRSLRDRLGDAFVCGVVLHYGDRVQRLEERIFALPVSSLWSTWRWMLIRLPPGQTRFRHAFRCELRGFLQRNARMLRGLGPGTHAAQDANRIVAGRVRTVAGFA